MSGIFMSVIFSAPVTVTVHIVSLLSQ